MHNGHVNGLLATLHFVAIKLVAMANLPSAAFISSRIHRRSSEIPSSSIPKRLLERKERWSNRIFEQNFRVKFCMSIRFYQKALSFLCSNFIRVTLVLMERVRRRSPGTV